MNMLINYFYITILNFFIISNATEHRLKGKNTKKSLVFKHPYPFDHVNYFKEENSKGNSLQNTIKNDIRRAFQPMKLKDDTVNEMIELMCRNVPENPIYIFKIPMSDLKFKNFVMYRRDFEIPIYPNLTETHIQLAKLSKKIDMNKMPKPVTEKSAWFKYDDDDLASNENFQDDIVKSNMVTESNFINYVRKMNDKGEKFLTNEQPVEYHIKNHRTKSNQNHFKNTKLISVKNYWRNPKIDWAEFKSGQYHPLDKDHSTKFLNTNISEEKSYDKNNYKNEKNPNLEMPGDYGYLEQSEKIAKWDLPGKLTSNPLKNEDKYQVNKSNILKNMTILLTKESKPHWSLTANRDAHKNSDIFIARANDPFGHSTKWQLKNYSYPLLDSNEIRKKRGIKELYSMIKCSTGCDPLLYKGYGCFYGFMGSGIPVDSIDRCCKIHDDCYTKSKCPSYLEYFIPFLWKCYNGKPLCAYSHGEWGGPRSCAAQLCQCDLNLAKCFRKYHCPKRRAVCTSSYVRMIQNYLMIY